MNCTVVDCNKIIANKKQGLCAMHCTRLQRHGDVNYVEVIKDGSNLSSHELYYSYKGMVKRCTKSNATGYHKYGGRGITVCDKWIGKYGFRNFLEDMGERPKGTSIERIDNDGNYEPSNCKWATPLEQAHNRGVYATSKTGVNGVSKARGNWWRARIKLAGKEISLGQFKNVQDAINARKDAETKYWGGAYA